MFTHVGNHQRQGRGRETAREEGRGHNFHAGKFPPPPPNNMTSDANSERRSKNSPRKRGGGGESDFARSGEGDGGGEGERMESPLRTVPSSPKGAQAFECSSRQKLRLPKSSHHVAINLERFSFPHFERGEQSLSLYNSIMYKKKREREKDDK